MTRPDPFKALGELPQRVNTAGFLSQSAEAWPDVEAVIEAKSDRRISFAQLEARANHMAAGLHGLGVEFGDRVCLFVPASIEFVALTFALFNGLAVGRGYTPETDEEPAIALIENLARLLPAAGGVL